MIYGSRARSGCYIIPADEKRMARCSLPVTHLNLEVYKQLERCVEATIRLKWAQPSTCKQQLNDVEKYVAATYCTYNPVCFYAIFVEVTNSMKSSLPYCYGCWVNFRNKSLEFWIMFTCMFVCSVTIRIHTAWWHQQCSTYFWLY